MRPALEVFSAVLLKIQKGWKLCRYQVFDRRKECELEDERVVTRRQEREMCGWIKGQGMKCTSERSNVVYGVCGCVEREEWEWMAGSDERQKVACVSLSDWADWNLSRHPCPVECVCCLSDVLRGRSVFSHFRLFQAEKSVSAPSAPHNSVSYNSVSSSSNMFSSVAPSLATHTLPRIAAVPAEAAASHNTTKQPHAHTASSLSLSLPSIWFGSVAPVAGARQDAAAVLFRRACTAIKCDSFTFFLVLGNRVRLRDSM